MSAACVINILNPTVNINITGKWYVQVDTFRRYQNGVVDSTFVGDDGSTGDYNQYNADGTGFYASSPSEPADNYYFTYYLVDSTLVEQYPNQTIAGYVQYAMTSVFTIKKKTATQLVEYLSYPDYYDPRYTYTEHIYLKSTK